MSRVTINTVLSQTTTNLILDRSKWIDFKHSFWNADPYPHICIDDFLQAELFKKVLDDFKRIDKSAAPTETYSSNIELNKVCFEVSSSYVYAQETVNYLSSGLFIQLIESLLDITGVISLTKLRMENKSSRKYLHIMRDGGFLGSHVDQSHIEQKYIHILSCIFYASEPWDQERGGHTTLFSNDGSKDLKEIEYKSNRLAIFLHTSTSFHGVSKLKTDFNRYSIYMDYYLPVQNLGKFKNIFVKSYGKERPKYWEHDVTFFSRSQDNTYSSVYHEYLTNSQNQSMHFGTLISKFTKVKNRARNQLGKIKNKVLEKVKNFLAV